MILNADMTFTIAGTSIPEGETANTVEGNGTYTVDEVAGTIDMVYLNFSIDSTPQSMDIPILDYEVQSDMLTFTWPDLGWVMYTPAEPLVYIRQ